ncbi:MAG: hypothetical protein ACSLEL_01325 [Candidatus Malihini olakiniferum]
MACKWRQQVTDIKSIDLSSLPSITQGSPVQGEVVSGNAIVAKNITAPGQRQTLNVPSIPSFPTQVQVMPSSNEQLRVKLSGNMMDALSTQKEKINAFFQGETSGPAPVTTLPITLTTEAPLAKNSSYVSEKGEQEKASHAKSVQEKTAQSKLPLTPAQKNANDHQASRYSLGARRRF